MIFSGLRLTHGGLGDARLVNYILEHGYRWVMQRPSHESFWDVPVLYPYPHVSAFTEVMLGVGPYYWIWRWLGCAADTAFQLWILTVWSLNYAAAYFMLRSCVQAGAISAAFGACLMSFGSVLQIQLGHPQMIPLFYVALAIAALPRILGAADAPRGALRQRAWIAVFFTCAVLQAYACFYLFFFFGLFCALALLWSLAFEDVRGQILAAARKHWLTVSVCLLLASCALGVLARHYLITASEVGMRPYSVNLIPRWHSWLMMGPRNYLYGWVYALPFVPPPNPNHSTGVGLVTMVVCLTALLRRRHSPWIRVLLLAAGSLIVISTVVGDFSLWKVIHECVPGGKAIRAVGRIGIVLLVPAAVGLTLYLERLRSGRRMALFAVVALICLAEQPHRHGWIDKQIVRDHVRAIAARVDRNSQAFFMVRTGPADYRFVADDANWVQLATDVPTINGRYGNFPPNWGLREAQDAPVKSDADRAAVREALHAWVEGNDLDAQRVQIIEYEGLCVRRNQKATGTRESGPSPLPPPGTPRTASRPSAHEHGAHGQ
ncbi:MAG TPA: hypothetical protein VMY37_21925 [Thermoguttaceae bacterium]|nr:hypothetical protein [Thermoguttaceae bacterium]